MSKLPCLSNDPNPGIPDFDDHPFCLTVPAHDPFVVDQGERITSTANGLGFAAFQCDATRWKRLRPIPARSSMQKSSGGSRSAPFAPSILAESVRDWFEEDDAVPFMMQVFQIREEKRASIPAVTHVDGSGRLQTVTRETNPRYYRLIEAYRDLTSV